MTAFVICVGSSLLSITEDVTFPKQNTMYFLFQKEGKELTFKH